MRGVPGAGGHAAHGTFKARGALDFIRAQRDAGRLTDELRHALVPNDRRHRSQEGDSYRMGATGPDTWDCSSFTQRAYAQIGIRLPRTAAAQRSWVAAGNGMRISPGQEQPGDVIFWDSYLGPNQIGQVMIVWNPARKSTIEAHNKRAGVGHISYRSGSRHHIFEIWRIGNVEY